VWERWQRNDQTLSSSEFQWNEDLDEYRCPQGHALRSQWRAFKNPRTHITKADTIIYRSSQSDCSTCPMKQRCCPSTATRKIVRSIHESARDVARAIRSTVQYQRSRADSSPCRATIPAHAGPLFQSMPGHDSGACRATIPVDAGGV
jgi:hypothetical protein